MNCFDQVVLHFLARAKCLIMNRCGFFLVIYIFEQCLGEIRIVETFGSIELKYPKCDNLNYHTKLLIFNFVSVWLVNEAILGVCQKMSSYQSCKEDFSFLRITELILQFIDISILFLGCSVLVKIRKSPKIWCSEWFVYQVYQCNSDQAQTLTWALY